jgi:hypothetical protein
VIYTQFHLPGIARWQMRLARVPRWAWMAFFIGAVIPVIVLLVLTLAAAVITGLIVMGAVLIVGAGLSVLYRLLHRRHRSQEIVVRSVRIIDP